MADLSEDDRMRPYIVKTCKALDEMCEDKGVKAAVGVYKIQFPNGEQAKNIGRSQRPFQSDRKNRIQELLLNCVPQQTKAAKIDEWAERIVSTVSIFGCMEENTSTDIERNGLGNVRFLIQGSREVVVVLYDDLVAFAQTKSTLARGEKEEPIEYGKRIMHAVQKEDLEETNALKFYHGVHSQGEALITPMGCFISERTLPLKSATAPAAAPDPDLKKNARIIGWRTSFLEGKQSVGFRSFGNMTKDQKGISGDDDRTTKFWNAIHSSLQWGGFFRIKA